jgi:phosphoglycerol transferase MdoB-like AlkP superfamily enzyme
MPFIHRLQLGQENTITGDLEVSVCGGNTANTEFEFLTGHTMDYFPVGSIPYQQYITGNLPSLASQLLELGYATYGMHPYNSTGWKRNEVYPWLGFEKTYFVRDFENRFYIRDYVSDQTAYQKIIDIYEAKEEGKPAFIFEVTMQNHGGYTETHENFTPDVHATDLNSAQLDQYLSLMKVSDQEFENLVAYFENKEEKTIIVFFGDHQPSDAVVRPILRWNQNMGASEENAWLRYQVPYVIWANYDIEDGTDVDTDISFLAAQVLNRADMPTTAYQNFLLELAEHPDSDTLKNQYEILQYYFMFDYQETL